MRPFPIPAALLLAAALFHPARADDFDAAGAPEATEAHGESAGEEAHADPGFHRNHLAAFGGFAVADREAHPAAGLDYELRLGERWGLAALAEVAFAEEPAQVYGLGLAWHPAEAWSFALLPAWEREGEHQAFVARCGGEREFEVGDLTLAPSVGFDIGAEGLAPVIGVAVGTGF